MILWPTQVSGRPEAGGKALALAALEAGEFHIPPWFVVLPPVSAARIPEGRASLEADLPSPSAEEWRAAIDEALAKIAPAGELFAVRSSAVEEDGAELSFAGQFESFLGQPAAAVPDKVRAVWAAARSERLAIYRQQHGLTGSIPAVIVQRMVAADAAGVAFSADPVDGRRNVAVVAAVPGLGHGLASGITQADNWRVDRRGAILQRHIELKTAAYRLDPSTGGVRQEPLTDPEGRQATLTDAQVREVAALARQAAAFFERPQDIEWAYQNGCLHLLQSRPITALKHLPDPDALLKVWDNSNIVESYCGVTTPLTFSFIRRAYEEVYRQFCFFMGVAPQIIRSQDRVFRQMLGLIRGRVYYNLGSWYRVLAMLPGYRFNRRFMEQMMGVKESGELVEAGVAPAPVDVVERIRDAGRMLWAGLMLVGNYLFLSARRKRFHRRLHLALAPTGLRLEDQTTDELLGAYRALERSLLRRWDAPIANDFFAMIFFGLLRRLAQKWCSDSEGALCNSLVRNASGVMSVEPARRIAQLARLAREHPDSDFIRLLAEGSLVQINSASAALPRFFERAQAYLAEWGFRRPGELKLENRTLTDDPLPLYRAIARAATAATDTSSVTSSASPPPIDETDINQRFFRGQWMRRIVFHWVLAHARRRVCDRENMRIERGVLFDRVRRILLQIGARLYASGRLNNARDIFYLELDEIFGVLEGTATTTDLLGLVEVRRKEFEEYNRQPPLPNRLYSRGGILIPEGRSATKATAPPWPANQRRGQGCSPGLIRGVARIVEDPTTAKLQHGEILVAISTDPGWVLLFVAAGGMIIERGSLLSHSAIVARELKLPAVIGVEEATTWLQDGDMVEVDGATGVVTRLASAQS